MLGRRFEVTAPDLYGYGDAPSWSGPGNLSLSDEAARAASALPRDADPVHVVGHSYGGAVALRLAIEHSRRVRSLTLIEPVAFHTLRKGDVEDRRLLECVRDVAAEMIEGVVWGDYHAAMERFIDYWNSPGAWRRLATEARERLSRHAPKVVLDFHAAINERASFTRYRSRLRFPVLVLHGGLSPQPARRVAEILSQNIPGARLATVPGAGHMLPFSHAQEVGAAVIQHIAGRPRDDREAA